MATRNIESFIPELDIQLMPAEAVEAKRTYDIWDSADTPFRAYCFPIVCRSNAFGLLHFNVVADFDLPGYSDVVDLRPFFN